MPVGIGLEALLAVLILAMGAGCGTLRTGGPMRILATCLLLAALPLSTAHAEGSANDVLKTYRAASDDGKMYLRGYMIGLVTAYGYTNTALKAQKSAPFYCVPQGTDLGDEEVIGLMQRSIRKDSQLGRAPFGMALLAALQRRFPCKKPKGKDAPPTP